MSYKLYREGYQNSYAQMFFKRCCEDFRLQDQLFGNPILEIGGSNDFHGIHIVTEYPVVNLIQDPRACISGEGLSWVNVKGSITENQLSIRRIGSNIPKRPGYDMSEIIELEKTNPIFYMSSSRCDYDRAIDVDEISKSEIEKLKNKYPYLSIEALEKAIKMARECSKIDIDKAFDMIVIDMKDINTTHRYELMKSSSLPIIMGEVVPFDTDSYRDGFRERADIILGNNADRSAIYREDPLTDHLGNKLLFKCLYRPRKK